MTEFVDTLVDCLFIADAVVILVVWFVGSALVIKHRHDFPIADRSPALIIITSGALTVATILQNSNIMQALANQPCFLFHFSRVILIASVNFMLVRCWRLYVDNRVQCDQVHYIDTQQSSWFMQHRSQLRGFWVYCYLAVFCVGVSLVPLQIALFSSGTTQSDTDCRNFTRNVYWYVCILIWAFEMPSLTYLLYHVREGFSLKKEMTGYVVLLVFTAIFNIFAFISGPNSTAVHIAAPLSIFPVCTFAVGWQTLYPVSKTKTRVRRVPSQAYEAPDSGVQLMNLIANEGACKQFELFLKEEFSSENLYFYRACDKLLKSSPLPRDETLKLIKDFLTPGAPLEVNVNAKVMDMVPGLTRTLSGHCEDTLCDEEDTEARAVLSLAQTQVFRLMTNDSFHRFVERSKQKPINV